MPEVTVKPDENGNLVVPKEVLGELKPDAVFRVEREGTSIRLELAPRERKLHEIEDPEERMRAFEAFVKRVVQKGGGTLPEDWHTIRDSIYD